MRCAAGALGLGAAIGVWAQAPTSSWLVSANGVACDSGTLRLGWANKNLLEQTFPNGTSSWLTENYENALTFDRQQENGAPYLSLTGMNRAADWKEPARPLAFSQGVLTDTFPSYGVRVYMAE